MVRRAKFAVLAADNWPSASRDVDALDRLTEPLSTPRLTLDA